MSKLSFRARALDASKPMPIFMAEELPDLPDYSAINRAVPQMPSGMEKEEECEHHLQRAICTGIIIPTPEVSELPDKEAYDKMYPADYKQPRQLIHMQPFTMEQDITDYDMDSEDERWLVSQAQRLELDPGKFEEMMDRLEKSSGQTVVTLNEAKALLKEDDDLIIAVYDYWLNKRLRLQHPLILTVKTEQRAGIAANNPYLAFRRRTEKMQTRKNRKNDETSYEKMLKLKRDLCRAVTLLELVKRREKLKREYVNLTIEVFEKRYQTRDFSGSVVAEVAALKSSRPAFTPIFHNHYANQGWNSKAIPKDEIIPRKEKRQYKKRKHKAITHNRAGLTSGLEGALSSDEETMPHVSPEPEEVEDEGQFVFRRNKFCTYHMPIPYEGNWPWCSKDDNGIGDKRYRYTLASITNPRRCIGFARRRMGRGGRIILDRAHHDLDDFWRTADFTIYEPTQTATTKREIDEETTTTTTGTNLSDDSRLSNNYYVNNSYSNSSECVVGGDYRLRTSVSVEKQQQKMTSSLFAGDSGDVLVKSEPIDEVKVEPPGQQRMVIDCGLGVKQEQEEDDVVEFLKTVRKEWLHFRPKTPPPDYETPCHLLPADDSIFTPSANTPFSMELHVLDEVPSTILDTSSFVTAPFVLDDFEMNSLDEEVPITDTRQQQQQQQSSDNFNKNVQTGVTTTTTTTTIIANATPNTLNSSSVSNIDDDDDDEHYDEIMRTICCSRFKVLDKCASSNNNKKHYVVSSTLTSPKLNNSVNVITSDGRQQQQQQQQQINNDTTTLISNNANGLLTQFGLDGSSGCKTKNNKIPYAYSSGVGYSNAAPAGTLSLHTSAHTLTLSRHSANILEIPLSNDTEKVPNKVVNSQCTEGNGASPNNKNKTIVRKNNIVMEVT